MFESLVRAESSAQDCQLVYTTHSPFLINRNYPRRLRLVRKGDAEEGTQLIDQAMLRRYEPVRSALGIDCAQTLFMGATNVVVEGPTDQYLLSELVRRFITPDNVSELLDLNSIVMVSAESAPSVEKLLAASQWGDEPVPATVVVLDSDDEGDVTKLKITGKNLKPSQASDPEQRRGNKRLVEDQFVLQIGTVLGGTIGGQKIVTTEDVLPTKLFAEAIMRYVKRWHPENYDDAADKLQKFMAKPDFGENGLVAGATTMLNQLVHNPPKGFDKMGVLQEAVSLLALDEADLQGAMGELRTRLLKLCHEIRRAVSASQQAARRNSGKQSIQRLIDDYFKTHKEASSVFDIQLLLDRIQRDTKLLGEDGEKLDASLGRMLSELNKVRAADQQHFRGDAWRLWKQVIVAIRKNPLEAEVKITEDGPVPVGDGAESSATPAPERNGPEAKQPQPAKTS